MVTVFPKYNNVTFPKEEDEPSWRDENGRRYIFDSALRSSRKRCFGFHMKAPNADSIPRVGEKVTLRRGRALGGDRLSFVVADVHVVSRPLAGAERGPYFSGPIHKTFASKNVGTVFLRIADLNAATDAYDATLRARRDARRGREYGVVEEEEEGEEEATEERPTTPQDETVAVPTERVPPGTPSRPARPLRPLAAPTPGEGRPLAILNWPPRRGVTKRSRPSGPPGPPGP